LALLPLSGIAMKLSSLNPLIKTFSNNDKPVAGSLTMTSLMIG
jgi:hypothetical protein